MHEATATEPISVDSDSDTADEDQDGDTKMDGASQTKTTRTKGKARNEDPDVVIVEEKQPDGPKTPTKNRASPVDGLGEVFDPHLDGASRRRRRLRRR